MGKNPTYMALLGPTRLLISEKSTNTIKWSYTIIWQVRVGIGGHIPERNRGWRQVREEED